MDKIQLVIGESKNLTRVDFKSYDISVYLNDKKILHNLLAIRIIVCKLVLVNLIIEHLNYLLIHH